MKITKEEVSHVARLARLRLSDADAAIMTGQLDTILTYIAKLSEIDTSSVVPTTHVLAIVNAFREDETHPSLVREETLRNAPASNGEAFVVPRII